MPIKTLKVRIKDRHASMLCDMARSVNTVWNYVNDLSHRSIRERGRFLSAYDIQKYTSGCSSELGIHSQSVQCVAKEYVDRRNQFKKTKLAWRKSGGARRSLGWIPFSSQSARWKRGCVYYNGVYIKVWDSYGLSKYRFRAGSFNEDSRGRWYLNVAVDVDAPAAAGAAQGAVGVDLGLKDLAVCSDGGRLSAGRWFRGMEEKLSTAQRSRNKRRTRAIHAKIKNRRKDALHKFSRQLVNQFGEIYVGNVSSSKLAKTRMAKSVYDAGWGQLKTMLEYKCDHAGIVFKEVCEAYTSRTCSSCGSLSGPTGLSGLRVRDWECVDCGVIHDRDVNAARNILSLAVGHGRPVEGISRLSGCQTIIEPC